MTVAPQSIKDAAEVWTDNGGANAGIVGNDAHRRRQSYHNGKDAIDQYHRTAANDYSIRTSRDRKPTLAASAFDMGRLNGSLDQLREFSAYLVSQCRQGAPGTEDIREVIYAAEVNGKVVVLRWLRDRGVNSKPQPGEADDTHLTHTHVSWYRDAEDQDKTPPFTRYFAPEADMRKFVRKAGEPLGSLVVNGPGHYYLRASTDKFVGPVDPATFGTKENAILGTISPPFEGGTGDRSTVYEIGDETAWILAVDVKFTPYPVVDCSAQAKKAHDVTKAAAIAAVTAIP